MEDTLDHLALIVKGTGTPGLHKTTTIKKTVLGMPQPPKHSTDSRLKYDHSLLMKKGLLT